MHSSSMHAAVVLWWQPDPRLPLHSPLSADAKPSRLVYRACSAPQKARKVYLLLHKESDAEWRFLKS